MYFHFRWPRVVNQKLSELFGWLRGNYRLFPLHRHRHWSVCSNDLLLNTHADFVFSVASGTNEVWPFGVSSTFTTPHHSWPTSLLVSTHDLQQVEPSTHNDERNSWIFVSRLSEIRCALDLDVKVTWQFEPRLFTLLREDVGMPPWCLTLNWSQKRTR